MSKQELTCGGMRTAFVGMCQRGLTGLVNAADEHKWLIFGVTLAGVVIIFPIVAPTKAAALAELAKCAAYKAITAASHAATYAMNTVVGVASTVATALEAMGTYIYQGAKFVLEYINSVFWDTVSACSNINIPPVSKEAARFAVGIGVIGVTVAITWQTKEVEVNVPDQRGPGRAPRPARRPVRVAVVYPQNDLNDVTYAQFTNMNATNQATIVRALMAAAPPFANVQQGPNDQVYGRDNTACVVCLEQHDDGTRIVYRHRQVNADGGYTYHMLTCTECFVEYFTFSLTRHINAQIRRQAAAGNRVLSREFVEGYIEQQNIACPTRCGPVDRVYEESRPADRVYAAN